MFCFNEGEFSMKKSKKGRCIKQNVFLKKTFFLFPNSKTLSHIFLTNNVQSQTFCWTGKKKGLKWKTNFCGTFENHKKK